ncbi:MAG: hypothetical protein WJU30_00451 [Candidatus Phytoplasma pruni]
MIEIIPFRDIYVSIFFKKIILKVFINANEDGFFVYLTRSNHF